MEKNWYKSKTIWGSIMLAAIGCAQIYQTGSLNTEALLALASSLGIFGLRDAME